MSYFQRTQLLLGQEKFAKIQAAHILILGVGAVGSVCAESLVRSGVQNLTLLDFDHIESSNFNRQIQAVSSQRGRSKLQALGNRLQDISPTLQLSLIEQKLHDYQCLPLFQSIQPDFIADCLDSFYTKVGIIEAALALNLPFISSMGAAAKTDSSKIRISDIRKTRQCVLAKKIRKELRRKNIRQKVPVVWSEEPVYGAAKIRQTDSLGQERFVYGSIFYETAIFGLKMSEYIFNAIFSVHRDASSCFDDTKRRRGQ